MADKVNRQQVRYGTKDGEIKFGHLTADNQIDSVLIRNFYNFKHYIELCRTGEPHRKNGTILRSTGSTQIKAGDDVNAGEPAVFIDAVNGDVVIRAPSGKVRIEGTDVELTATGFDGSTGNVNISANEKIILDAGQTVDVKSKVSTKIFSEKTVEVIGKAVLNLYGEIIDCADGASTSQAGKGSKGGSDNEDRMRGLGGGLTA